MTPLEECCTTCPACSRPVCRELGEECQHDGPVCVWCCPTECKEKRTDDAA